MPKNAGRSRPRKPSIDALEDRYLLTTTDVVPGLSVHAAIVTAVDHRPDSHPADEADSSALAVTLDPEPDWPEDEPVSVNIDSGDTHPDVDGPRSVAVAPSTELIVAVQSDQQRSAGPAHDSGSRSAVGASVVAPAVGATIPLHADLVRDDRPESATLGDEKTVKLPRPDRGSESGLSPEDPMTVRGSTQDGSEVDADFSASDPQLEIPAPRSFGLIGDVLPFDRASLDRAIEQLFGQLDDLGLGQLVEPGPTQMLPISLALLCTGAVLAVAWHLRRTNGDRQQALAQGRGWSEDLFRLPELPGAWPASVP